MNLATMIKQTSVAVERSALGLAAAAVLGMGVSANAQLPVTDGLIVWLKADAVDTGDIANQVRLSGSDIYVKRWVDSSPNNHPASNSAEGDQPLYIANGLNGMPVLRFAEDNDDNGDRLYMGDLSASFPNAGTVFVVSTINNDGRYNLFGNRNGNDERWVANTWNESRPGSFRGARSANASFTFSDWPQTGAHVFALESSSAAFRFLIDGTEIGSDTGDYNSGSGSDWTIANRAGGGQQLKGDIPELIIFNRILTPDEANLVGGYLAGKYGLTGTTYPLSVPAIPAGLTATGVAGAVDLSWPVAARATSYNVKRAAGGGGPYSIIGNTTGTAYADITGTIGTPYYYVVTATNTVGESGISTEASAARLIGTAKNILTMSFGSLGAASISGTNIVKNVPVTTDLTALAPTYTVSIFATNDLAYPSGTARNFTTPQTYTVTAEDGSTRTYVVKVFKTTSITYDFNSGLQGWTQIWPALPATLWYQGFLGEAGGQADNYETRFGRSPEFYLTNLGDLTYQLRGGQSPLAAPAVGPAAIPELAVNNGGFAGVALRDVAADTYVMSRRKNGSDDNWQTGSFTAAELAPYANNGKKYTLDYIDYNKGGWGWTSLDNVSIPGTLVIPVITGMTLPPFDAATIVGNAITLRVSHGLNLATIAPSYTISPIAPFATSTPASGIPTDFSSGPVNYRVISEDLLATNVFTVTIVELADPASTLVGHWVSFAENLTDSSGHLPGTHDGTAVGNTGALAYSPDVPPGFAGSSLDLTAGGVGVSINNSSTNDAGYVNTFDQGIRGQCTVAFWAKGFPGQWAPWVSKFGENGIGWQLRRMENSNFAGFTIRGLDNDDGTGSSINVNDSPAKWHHFAGVWDQAFGTRKLFVDGVLSHVNNNTIGQMMSLAAGHHLGLGARQNGDASGYDTYFAGLLYDVRIYNQVLFSNQVQVVMTTPTAPQNTEAKMKTFGFPNWPAVINTSARTINWVVPFGTDLTALSPTFTLSTGATCDKVSGSVVDFSKPQTYKVTSSDSLLTAVYTVTAKTGWNFNDGTLQGWHNRVWDLAANEGAGGWADLAPNATAMTNTINGGVIQPNTSPDPNYNQLYTSAGGIVTPIWWTTPPGYPADTHANTMWLRSPEFYLNRTGDLTVQLAGGVARTGAPANEAAVPMASIANGGWMGVVLRRVSDNAFVLIKTKTEGQSNNTVTMTFTQAELAPYAGSKAYTLEFINADSGGWGWVTMDNVFIPGSNVMPKFNGTLLTIF